MRVTIGKTTIPDATVRRYIDMERGIPYSMIEISYADAEIDDSELVASYNQRPQTILAFECEVLKTKVTITGHSNGPAKHAFMLQEDASEVGCSYKLADWSQPTGNEKMVFLVPQNVRDSFNPYELSLLPFIRFIPRKDIPERWLKERE